MSAPNTTIDFKIPEQDVSALSFCSPTTKHLSEWVDGLPRMNVGECAKQLYRAVQEINHLKTKSATRLEMLELLREPIHYVCDSLKKHYLNKSVILQPKEAKVATLAQAIQNHLAIGYKIIITDALLNRDRTAKRLVGIAIHRTLMEKSEVLLRAFQLYYPAPKGFWNEIHNLWLAARQYQLQDHQEHDSVKNYNTSISDAYSGLLLLATAKTNQLRQPDIQGIYDLAFNWSRLTELTDIRSENTLFAINLHSDAPPNYEALVAPNSPMALLHFNPRKLSDRIRGYLESPDNVQPEGLLIPPELDKETLRLLVQAWGVLTHRSFTRIKEAGNIKIAVGLSSVHYFVSDKMDFDSEVRQAAATGVSGIDFDGPFSQRVKNDNERNDNWGVSISADASTIADKTSSIDAQISEHKDSNPQESDRYKEYDCHIIDTSPSGYCLSWQHDVPPQVRTGELVSIRESNASALSVGIIRWVKQFKNEGARIGVELLAPKSEAVGAQTLQKCGSGSDFMRALILPALKAIGQASTLITPRVSFQVGQKVNLYLNGRIVRAQLLKLISSTASIYQFHYKLLDAYADKPSTTATSDGGTTNENDFDSIWSSL